MKGFLSNPMPPTPESDTSRSRKAIRGVIHSYRSARATLHEDAARPGNESLRAGLIASASNMEQVVQVLAGVIRLLEVHEQKLNQKSDDQVMN